MYTTHVQPPSTPTFLPRIDKGKPKLEILLLNNLKTKMVKKETFILGIILTQEFHNTTLNFLKPSNLKFETKLSSGLKSSLDRKLINANFQKLPI